MDFILNLKLLMSQLLLKLLFQLLLVQFQLPQLQLPLSHLLQYRVSMKVPLPNCSTTKLVMLRRKMLMVILALGLNRNDGLSTRRRELMMDHFFASVKTMQKIWTLMKS